MLANWVKVRNSKPNLRFTQLALRRTLVKYIWSKNLSDWVKIHCEFGIIVKRLLLNP